MKNTNTLYNNNKRDEFNFQLIKYLYYLVSLIKIIVLLLNKQTIHYCLGAKSEERYAMSHPECTKNGNCTANLSWIRYFAKNKTATKSGRVLKIIVHLQGSQNHVLIVEIIFLFLNWSESFGVNTPNAFSQSKLFDEITVTIPDCVVASF